MPYHVTPGGGGGSLEVTSTFQVRVGWGGGGGTLPAVVKFTLYWESPFSFMFTFC